MRYVLLLITATLFSCVYHTALAKNKAGDDPKLKEIVSRMKSADNYAYTLTIYSEAAANKNEHQLIEVKNYYSRSNGIQYARSTTSHFFICKRGMFKADIDKKQIAYKQFTSDSMWQSVQHVIQNADAAQLVDSLFFNNATISRKAQVKTMLTYELTYPSSSMITGLELTYNTTKGVVNSITYSLDRSVDGSNRKGTMIHQKVSMKEYDQKTPQEVIQILQQSDDLKSYLQQTYAGYKIINL